MSDRANFFSGYRVLTLALASVAFFSTINPASAQEAPSLRDSLPGGLGAAIQEEETAPLDADAPSALPSGAEVSPRSPGFQLPADAGAGGSTNAPTSNPFAPPPVQVAKSAEQVEAEIRTRTSSPIRPAGSCTCTACRWPDLPTICPVRRPGFS